MSCSYNIKCTLLFKRHIKFLPFEQCVPRRFYETNELNADGGQNTWLLQPEGVFD